VLMSVPAVVLIFQSSENVVAQKVAVENIKWQADGSMPMATGECLS